MPDVAVSIWMTRCHAGKGGAPILATPTLTLHEIAKQCCQWWLVRTEWWQRGTGGFLKNVCWHYSHVVVLLMKEKLENSGASEHTQNA